MNITIVDHHKKVARVLKNIGKASVINVNMKLSAQMESGLNDHLVNLSEFIEKVAFDKTYIDFIASLGDSCRSKYWWANSLSEKNELLSKFYHRFFFTLSIAQYVRVQKPDTLIILSCDRELNYQLEQQFVHLGYVAHITGNWMLTKRTIRNVFRLSCKIGLIFVREVYRMMINRMYLSRNIERAKSQEGCYLIKTMIDHRSYKTGTYIDSYFGRLVEYVNQSYKNVIIVADVIQDYLGSVKKIWNDKTYLIITLESCLTVHDLIGTIIESFVYRIKLKKRHCVGDVDVSHIVNVEMSECFYSTKFLENLLYNKKLFKIAQTIDCQRYLYTFENFAWEKMGIIGLKMAKRNLNIIGFQHAFISLNSFRYFPGEKEADLIPLPDKIITLGQVTKSILERLGHFSSTDITEGCALRQEKTLNFHLASRQTIKNIFVPFTITVEDTVKFLNFIYEAGLGDYPYNLFLRFHPVTPVNKVLSQINFSLPNNFIISKGISLEEEFKRCGVVLYTWTTVCIEALMVGLPVIYLDLNYPLNVDPLFDLNELKRVASHPSELLAKINDLLNMDHQTYEQDSRKAREYVQRYLLPVNEEHMVNFIN